MRNEARMSKNRQKNVLLTVQRVRMTTKKERNNKTDCMAAP